MSVKNRKHNKFSATMTGFFHDSKLRSRLWSGMIGGLMLLSVVTTVSAANSGDLDVSFGVAGTAVTSFPDFALASAIVVQPDGKIVVAGGLFDVVRYTPDGALDPAFDNGGKVSYSLGFGNNAAFSVALQSDGKIVIAGESDPVNTDNGLVVMRLNPNGSLDTSFGGDGIASVPMNIVPGVTGAGVAIQSDGKIVTAGATSNSTSGDDFVVVRFNANGSLDSGFGSGGIVSADNGPDDEAHAVVVQPDGKILAGGTTKIDQFDSDFMMVRYNPNGTPDNSFGTAGKVVSKIGTSYDQINALALQPDGKIVAAGSVVSDSLDLAIVRYTSAGQLDIGHFGSGGKLLVDFSGDRDSAAGVAVDPNGFIVAGGTSTNFENGTDFVMVRCEDDGDLDATFGNNGKVRADYGSSTESVSGLALQLVHRFGNLVDYKILLAGNLGTGPGSMVVRRYHSHTGPIFRAAVNDFDGDTRSELAVFRPSTGDWIIGNLPQVGFPHTQVSTVHWGTNGDIVAPGDYDGDGKYDVAVYRAGAWYILLSGNGALRTVPFGLAGDIPVPADYDGDGRTDVAVYRPSTGAWYYLRSSDQSFVGVLWGASGDRPVVGDYDGDDRADLAVYRGGLWYILQSSNGQLRAVSFGLPTDKPVPFDYGFDGKTDVAVFRDGDWYILDSATNSVSNYHWGTAGDVPVPGRYGGETSFAIYRSGTFWIDINSMEPYWVAGTGSDLAVPTFFAP